MNDGTPAVPTAREERSAGETHDFIPSRGDELESFLGRLMSVGGVVVVPRTRTVTLTPELGAGFGSRLSWRAVVLLCLRF
jgi:hypothetical protein